MIGEYQDSAHGKIHCHNAVRFATYSFFYVEIAPSINRGPADCEFKMAAIHLYTRMGIKPGENQRPRVTRGVIIRRVMQVPRLIPRAREQEMGGKSHLGI